MKKIRKAKKFISLTLTFAFIIGITSTSTVSASFLPCACIPWGGSNGYTSTNLKFQISGIERYPFWMRVFTPAASTTTGWNNASSRVKITEFQYGGSNSGHILVHSMDIWSGYLGQLMHRDANGVLVDASFAPGNGSLQNGVNANWHRLEIHMQSDLSVWHLPAVVSNAVVEQRVAATFMHEVGHVLKLDHPTCSGSNPPDNHSVIRGGFADRNPARSANVTQHDRNLLRRRWGN
jgi:hypothetical protein